MGSAHAPPPRLCRKCGKPCDSSVGNYCMFCSLTGVWLHKNYNTLIVVCVLGFVVLIAVVAKFQPVAHRDRGSADSLSTPSDKSEVIPIGTEFRLRSATDSKTPWPLARSPEVLQEMQNADDARIERMMLEGKFIFVPEGTRMRVVDSQLADWWQGINYKAEIEEGEDRGEYGWVGGASLSRLLARQAAAPNRAH